MSSCSDCSVDEEGGLEAELGEWRSINDSIDVAGGTRSEASGMCRYGEWALAAGATEVDTEVVVGEVEDVEAVGGETARDNERLSRARALLDLPFDACDEGMLHAMNCAAMERER